MRNIQDQNQINNKFNPNQINTNFESAIANPMNYAPEETQDYSDTKVKTLSGKPLIPEEKGYYDEEESFSEEVKRKSNLLFGEKQVSAFKLYCHLSEAYEVFLMIMGTIAALASGVAGPLLCYLFGDMANDFGSVNVDDDQMKILEQLMKCKNDEEIAKFAGGDPDKIWSYTIIYNQAKEMFKKFDDNVDSLVRKLLIIGACMFISFGLQKFLWCYAGLRQMHHLKEKYFAVILRQENLVLKFKLNLSK